MPAIRASIAVVAVVAIAGMGMAGAEGAGAATRKPAPKPPAMLRAACKGTLVASTTGTVQSNAVTEASGIAASGRVNDVYWVHNDSGDSARVFAIGGDGRDLGEYDLADATAVDWEDIDVGPGPASGVSYIYIGDIGDNAQNRPSVVVYRVREPLANPDAPAPPPQTLSAADALTFTYPDGPHDAEALIVDPVRGDIYIVTKDLIAGRAQVFRAPPNLEGGTTTMLTQVATLSLGPLRGVTGGDVTRAGDVVALRTYFSVVLFPRPAGQPLAKAFSEKSCAGAAPRFGALGTGSERQGEAIGFTQNGRAYLTLSEGEHTEVHRFAVP